MEYSDIRVRMLGNVSLVCGDAEISCEINRQKRVWSLFAYILHNRRRVVSTDELLGLMWNDDGESANPAGALKTTMFRLRSVLNSLAPELGHTLILYKNGGYTVNPELNIKYDTDEFEEILSHAREYIDADEPDELVRALSLYDKDFCTMQASEAWVLPVAAYYRNLYVELVEATVPMLEKRERYDEAVSICRRALTIDAYSESFYQLLMRILLAMGNRQEVVTVYEDMSKLLLSTFGVMPDKESRALYREALRTVITHTISPVNIDDELREVGPITGALLCDFDFFKNIYQAQARMISRSGDAIHIAVCTISGKMKKDLAKRSLETAMDSLEKHICSALRKGDLVTRCSASQFLIMLPQANYENSCMVCERVIKSFFRQYPHSPIEVDYFVKPLIPSVDAPSY